jgi:two-component system, cell cycle sensor histidine kinase and response regulator CckA
MKISFGSAPAIAIVFFATLVGTLFFADIRTVYESPGLLLLCNTVFLGLIPLVVAYTLSRIFLSVGNVSYILFSSGMCLLGAAGIVCGWFITTVDGPNIMVTIYNSSMLLNALLQMAAVICAPYSFVIHAGKHRWAFIITGCLVSASSLGMLILAALHHALPLYVIQGSGQTLTGRLVLGIAIMLLAVCSLLGRRYFEKKEARVIRLYSTGLALFAIGLLGVFLQKAVGSPIGWAGRTAQYVGAVYFLAGVLSFWKTKGAGGLTYHGALDELVTQRAITMGLSSENERLERAIQQRVRSQKLLAESDARHISMISNVADVIGIMGADGIIGYKSPNIEKWFGWKPQDLVGTSGWLTAHPDDRERLQKEFASLLKADNSAVTVEYRYKCKDGNYRMIELVAKNLTNDPIIGGVLLNYHDITERKQAEDAQQELFNRLQKIASQVPGVVYQYQLRPDGTSCFPYASEGINEIYRVTPGEVREDASKVFANLHPDDYDGVAASIQASAKELSPWKYEYRAKFDDGTVLWLLGNAMPQREADGTILWHGFITDISDRKAVEDKLKESETNFRVFFNSIADFLFVLDEQGNMLHVNETVAHRLKYSTNELIGRNVLMVHPEDQRAEAGRIVSQMIAGTADFCPVPLITKSGEFIQVETRVYPGSWNGQPALFGVTKDITERKQAEEREKVLREKLSRAERMESLGVLAGGVAHDLNNILGPLVLLPDLISEDLADLEKFDVKATQKDLSVITDAANRAATIVRDLVSLGRRGHFTFVHMDVSQIQCISPDGTGIKRLKTENRNVTFSNKPNKGPLIISGDESHLSRVVLNLVQNAVESIEKKGKVTIKTSKKSLDTPLVGYETVPQGDYAVIEISDTGEGIDKEIFGRIFEPFYTRKKRSDRSGSGLGLSVVHGIVKDHHGFMDVKSDVGKGSVFALYLPLVAQSQEESGESGSAPVIGGTERVLVVDDEPGQRFIACRSLKRLGYEVAEAEDGHQAVKLFEQRDEGGNLKPESPFDLIVLDMIMEEGFDGLDTYKAILKLYPNQKVIIASGHSEDGRAKDAVDLGAHWLAKPYQRDGIAGAVRKRLEMG